MPEGNITRREVRICATMVLAHQMGHMMEVDDARAGENVAVGSAATVNAPSLDLEAYGARYSGHSKIARLLFIAQHCRERELDALRIAINALKQNINTDLYSKAVSMVDGRLGNEYNLDTQWVDRVDRKAAVMRERLEGDLQSSRTSMAKESIRLGYMDLGDFCYRRGDLDNALKSFVRSRDYCHLSRHTVDMCLCVIKVSIDLNAWSHVHNYLAKAEHTPDLRDTPLALNKLKAIAGLAQMTQHNYGNAARKFLECSSVSSFGSGGESTATSPLGSPEGTRGAGGEGFSMAQGRGMGLQGFAGDFSQIMAPEDVATYASLCALASFDRQELRSRVIDNVAFKAFLDLVPQVRELITDFCHSRYGSCLRHLQELQPELLLDLHLHRHVPTLCRKIRERFLLQFFTPYKSVDLVRMSHAFGTSIPELEEDLARLITHSNLPARIDSEAKQLHRRQVNRREETFRKVANLGQEAARELRWTLLHMSLMEHNLFVEAPRVGRGGGLGMVGRGVGVGPGERGREAMEEDPEEVVSVGEVANLQEGLMES